VRIFQNVAELAPSLAVGIAAALAAEPRVAATVIQTVGSKGYDGFAVAIVTGDGE
jgi:hypothetical protein